MKKIIALIIVVVCGAVSVCAEEIYGDGTEITMRAK